MKNINWEKETTRERKSARKQKKMSSKAKTSSTTAGEGGGGGCDGGRGFRAKMEHYLYNGEKKHVFAGLVIISVVFAVPWYLMNQGAKHQSHQDYLEKTDKARSERLSSGTPAAAK